MVTTTEAVGWAGSLCAERRNLVRIVSAVIVAVTQPEWFSADVRRGALHLLPGARPVVGTV